MSEAGDYLMVLPFDVDHPEFARGFEAGRVWEMMQQAKRDAEEFRQLAHASNAEMFIRMGESLGIEVTAEPVDDTWIDLRVAGWVLITDDGAEVS
jgi:hypothetical protein